MPNRRQVIKRVGTGVALAAVSSNVVGANSNTEWASYQEALTEKYNKQEATRAIELARSTIENPSAPTKKEIKRLYSRVASDNQTGALGEDFESVIYNQNNNNNPIAGTVPDVEGEAWNAAESTSSAFTGHTRRYEFREYDEGKEETGLSRADKDYSEQVFRAKATSSLFGSATAYVEGRTGEITQLYNTKYEAKIKSYVADGYIVSNPYASFDAYFEIVNSDGDVIERRVMASYSTTGEYEEPGKVSITFFGDKSREWYIQVRIEVTSNGGEPNIDESSGGSTSNFFDDQGGLYMTRPVVDTLGFQPDGQ